MDICRRFNATSSENDGYHWRRAELTDLPRLNDMTTDESRQAFGFPDIARTITDNPLSLCQINTCSEGISIFLSLSGRPNVYCADSVSRKEWLSSFYGLNDAEENNTLFVNCLLFRCSECLIHLPVLLEMVYVQMPDIEHVILVKLPGTEFCEALCLPFTSILAKNVEHDPESGRPEILHHTKAFSINKMRLRNAIVDDFIDLRANLKTRLDFLDECYGQYSLAHILEFPGEGRSNFVPTNEVNGLTTITTAVDYSLLDSVFDLQKFTGLVELIESQSDITNITSQSPADPYKTIGSENVNSSSSVHRFEDSTEFFKIDQSSSNHSTADISADKSDLSFKGLCDVKLNNIIKDFLKFQYVPYTNESSSNSGSSNDLLSNKNAVKLKYRNTAFIVELMLIDKTEEKKVSWDYLVAYFNEYPQYDYCLMNLRTLPTPPEYKKFFCRAHLKPNCEYPLGLLYLLHRSCLFGDLTCVIATENHLEIMESLIEYHPSKNIVSNNISKSVFNDTRYKTYIFMCDSNPVGYCVIRLVDEMKMLSSNYDVARYVYTRNGRNHMAVLLNMDFQMIFVKKVRCFLKRVMEDGDLNCLFYKLYSDPTVMERNELSYITGLKELIPIKPRTRIQYDQDGGGGDDKFALFHMNMRLCTTQHISIDAKIVVVGASVVALSFLEQLLFNPVNYYKSFENIVLVSDCGIPYQVNVSGLEDRMIPKVSHYNYEYMQSIGINRFIDVIVGTVTAINRADKCVVVDGIHSINYDYLFLFNGQQFTYNVKVDEPKKSHKPKLVDTHPSNSEHDDLDNLFLLNSERDVKYAFNYIRTMRNNNNDVVVYGRHLGSLSVINVLLDSGIDGSRIVYVESSHGKNEKHQFIISHYIASTVYEELHKRGVRVYKQFVFDNMTLNNDQTKIQEVSFKSNDGGRLKTNCAGLFWFDQKYIKPINWLSLIRSSFKFNGRLVVSSSFETNVEHVYAAGPVAEFVQNDSLLSLKHVFYNSVEIGARVADMLMQRVGIRVDNYRIKAKYVRPLSIYCKLPGNYNYLHSTVPDVKIQKCSAKTLRTESAAGRYFEMIVDNRDVVLQLSCYSKRDFKYLNLINLCGKNVNLFNDMMDRLSTESIPCLFDYFDESWAYPLYSDRFWKLLDYLLSKLTKKNNKGINSFLGDDVTSLVSEHNAETVSELWERAGLDGRFNQIYTEQVHHVLLKFIDDNIDDFPAFRHVRDAINRMNSNVTVQNVLCL